MKNIIFKILIGIPTTILAFVAIYIAFLLITNPALFILTVILGIILYGAGEITLDLLAELKNKHTIYIDRRKQND